MARVGRERPRVFLGLANIAGFATGVAGGMAACGVRATVVEMYPERYGYPGERHFFTRCFGALARLKGEGAPAAWRWLVEALVRALGVVCFVWAAATHDVFIFSFRSSFCVVRSFADWRVLRLFGRRVVCMCHGGDVRPPYLDATHPADSAQDIIRHTRRMARACRAMERGADAVICNPAFAHFFSRPVVNVFRVGIPAPAQTAAPPRRSAGGAPVLVHCPSSMAVKGSAEIARMVKELVAEGVSVDYRELSGVPHAEVLATLAGADVAVDQLWSDTPMPGFATEAARYGVPCVVGGSVAEWIRRWTAHAAFALDNVVPPRAVKERLRVLLTDAEERRRTAHAAREFVDRHRRPQVVAERLLRVARGELPPQWYCAPQAAPVAGIGLSRHAVRQRIRAVVDAGGLSALCVRGPVLGRVLQTLSEDDHA